MAIFKPMRDVLNINLVDKYLEIKEDLLSSSNELTYRYEYYTKKYRGNRLNDINVGIFSNGNHVNTVQIFVRNKEGYIRNQFTIDYKGRLLDDNLKVQFND